MSKSILARTEPAAAGGKPQIVRVEHLGNGGPVAVVCDVVMGSSATDNPSPDINDLPTVTEVLHRLDGTQND